jgi:hypothetical protein
MRDSGVRICRCSACLQAGIAVSAKCPPEGGRYRNQKLAAQIY